MSYNHSTEGWEAYEGFVRGLKAAGVDYREELKLEYHDRGGSYGAEQQLRLAHYTTADGTCMVVEEYLKYRDDDSDGTSIVDIGHYEEGHRPLFVTFEVREDWSGDQSEPLEIDWPDDIAGQPQISGPE